ncbi:hypothetical protein GWN26_04315 [Candidatus Saccharibacteria bacterium]|nr:hypothetical protein [Calditrichia bacterium]NIV71727.1 hypothetical protein [Calditrichia bacterium]NIV98405.1 hypothetical protein [Candidatus Saccharibacteria bacterium]
MIEGVEITPLQFEYMESGREFDLLLSKFKGLKKFECLNFTTTHPQEIHSWRVYADLTKLMICFIGTIKLVLFDGRRDSETFGELTEAMVGEHQLQVFSIPNDVYHGWKCLSDRTAWVMQAYSKTNPKAGRLPFNTDLIPYCW